MVSLHPALAQTNGTMDTALPEQTWDEIFKPVYYAYPALVFIYFFVSLAITVCTLQTKHLRVQDQHVRRGLILALILATCMTYLLEGVSCALQVILHDALHQSEAEAVYLISSIIVFGIQGLALTDSKFPVWYPYYGTWFIGAICELGLLVSHTVHEPPESPFAYAAIIAQSLRVVLFLTLISVYFGVRNDKKEYDNGDAECQSLLRKKLAPKCGSSEDSTLAGNGYGTTDANQEDSDQTDAASDTSEEDSYLAEQRKAQEKINARLEQDGNWFTYAKGFAVFFPYVWPFHDKGLQFRAALVGLCLLSSNAFNVLVPRQMGIMIDSLTKYTTGDKSNQIWLPVAGYAILLFISGGACVGWLKQWLWLPIEQYSYNALTTASHAHIMNLSSDFHDNKTSSDLSQAISGGRSVSQLLETICFQVIPMFIDLAVAFAYLWSLFGPFMGLMMVATAVSYLYATTKLVARRAELRRDYIRDFRKEWTIGQASLDGWNTASLFNMIPHESQKYAGAVKQHMKTKKSYDMSAQSTSAIQALILTGGLMGALLVGAYQVSRGGKSVGEFSTLLVYWVQLQGPLVFFSTMYRQIAYSLMDAERLLELFQTKPTITDKPHARPLRLDKGLVKFDRVSFAYDQRKPTLKNVSFAVPPGKTVALVGETGGGKSTILKLIDRFYDVKGGSISIDGQDIRDVTLDSLRSKIGVVPQEPMLFNDSIMNNIRYARLSATDQEVYEACKAAAVHDKIMSFPDGYNSKVGDRGVKLSGGEKQRVAIARAILKQPEIILLDEATSAVDTETELLIQKGFKTLCKGRTTFIVAHRLSTIIKADNIVVVMNGEIIEEGSHEELIRTKGKYHDLWSKQIFATPASDAEGDQLQIPRKSQPNIVNDLAPSQHKAEMAKLVKSPEEETAAQVQGKDTNKKQVGGHKRESSKLKPDAREFIPQQSRTSSPEKPVLKDLMKQQKKQEKEDRKAASLSKKAGKRALRQSSAAQDVSPLTSRHANVSKEEAPGGDSISPKETTKRKSSARLSKRQMAKSEPTKSTPTPTVLQQYPVMTTDGAGDFLPMLQPPQPVRRVSAPSDPPPTTISEIGGPRARRGRRSRHWRLKNRTVEGTVGDSGSGITSGTEQQPTPPAPSPRPASPCVDFASTKSFI